MQITSRSVERSLILLLALFAPAAFGQLGNDHRWARLRSKNPSGLRFSLRLLDARQYRHGELIQVDVRPPRRPIRPSQGPAEEHWQFSGFLLDPEVGCGSLSKPCMMSARLQLDKSDPMLSFGARSEPLTLPLNTYIPTLPPGRYRVAALARKLVFKGRAPLSSTYGYADPPQFVVSDAVEFQVVPASAAWIQRRIASSIVILKGSPPRTPEAYKARKAAAQQLQFLDHPAAWQASLDLLPVEENTLLRRFPITTKPARVCELMRSRIAAPEQSVSLSYLSTMTLTCERANFPPPPTAGSANRDRETYFGKLRAYRSSLMQTSTATLAATLPRKQPEPKAIAFTMLFQHIQQLRSSEPEQPAPVWMRTVTREFLHSFSELAVVRRRYLLELYVSTVDSSEVIPLCELVLDAWKPGDYYEATHAALRALSKADPPRAQSRILAELGKQRTWLDAPLLELLPASAARPMDDALIEALASAQRPSGWNPRLRMVALAKYATPRAANRIRAIYESQQEPCQPELMAYFVRVDPAYADRVFRSHSWDMQAPPPPCTARYFERTAPLAMHPVLEKYMAAYLQHRDVFVKTMAARSLGRYGTKTALMPLWNAFRYFHAFWKGKGAELTQNNEGVSLEVELRNAIARGRHWLTTEADLRTIEALCISERCLYETQQDLRAWHKPLRIELSEQPDRIRGTVAQYHGLETVAAIEAKLAQFTRGERFVLVASGANSKQTVAEIRTFAANRGFVVTTPGSPARGRLPAIDGAGVTIPP